MDTTRKSILTLLMGKKGKQNRPKQSSASKKTACESQTERRKSWDVKNVTGT